jgi:triacylglycerol esterase/lipase EstA (alpha/beta hydrolase family)
MIRAFALALALTMLLCSCGFSPAQKTKVPTTYPYVFVHGLNGYGDDSKLPVSYWGGPGGSLLEALKTEGYLCFAPTVSAAGSAWDRACELYAAITGAQVDYGAAHSAAYGHDRFGSTYDTALLPDWGTVDGNGNLRKLNLIAHSFGGATARLFCSLLQNGSPEERDAAARGGGSVSPLFEGGKGDWIFSLTCLAAPHNGVSLLALVDANSIMTLVGRLLGNVEIDQILASAGVTMSGHSLGEILQAAKTEDTAYYDLTLDGAKLVNQTARLCPETYYFSYPVDGTDENGRSTDDMGALLGLLATLISSFTAQANLDDDWKPNDGLVNTISATYPFGQAKQEVTDANLLGPASLQPASWYVMPTVRGDHGSIVGLGRTLEQTLPLYSEQMARIDALSRQVTG